MPSASPNFCAHPALPEDALDRALSICRTWPVEHVSVAVTDRHVTQAVLGDVDVVYRLASLSKVFTSWAVLIAVEEGSVSLDDPVGPPGATLRHCLAHAAGYPFDGRDPIARPGTRRIYSNTGIEVAAEHVTARTDMPFADYLADAVLAPLRLDRTRLDGSPAHGLHSCVRDVAVFMRELLEPTLISHATAADALSVQFPGLAGVVPGMGSFDPNPWGLGMEIHGDKYPHWMGRLTSPRTVGHFGGAGTMFWVDPDRGFGLVALTNRSFDEWADVARSEWAALSDAIVSANSSTGSSS